MVFCRDERIISRAIELNEQLQKVLAKHDDLLAGRVTMTTTRFDHEEEEEEPEQLVQRCLPCFWNSIYYPFVTKDNTKFSEFFHLCMSNPLQITGYDHPLSIESPSREVDTRSPPVVIPPSREADARSSPVVIPPPRSKQNGEVPHPVAIPPHLQSTLRGRGFFRRTRMVLICLATWEVSPYIVVMAAALAVEALILVTDLLTTGSLLVFLFHFCLNLELVLFKPWGMGDFSFSLSEYGDGRRKGKPNQLQFRYRYYL